MKRVQLTRPLRSVSSTYVKPKSKISGNNPPTPDPSLEGQVGGGLPSSVLATEKDEVEELVAKAKQLSPSKFKQLLAKLALANQNTSEHSDRDVDMWASAVHDRLCMAVGGSGEGVAGPAVIKRVVGSPTSFGAVQSFMRLSKLAELTVTERQAAYSILAKLVIDHARYVSRESHVPMSPKLVSNCSTNITGIFQQSFPGYVESGLAKLVVRRMSAH